MPRFALLSDVHGNLEALEATLASIGAATPDFVVCLGDVVGYGPDPAACVELVYEACDAVVMGNHEAAMLEHRGPDWHNAHAQAATAYSRERMGRLHRKVIESWPHRAALGGVGFAHATFGARRYEYVQSADTAARAFAGLTEDFGAVGHTHVPSAFVCEGSDAAVKAYQLPGGPVISLPEGRRYIVNPGSVGQPRDRNPDAAWAMLDTDRRTLQVTRVAYNVDAVGRKIRAAGLPHRLGDRLLLGA